MNRKFHLRIFSILFAVLLLPGCAATYDGPTQTRSILASEEEMWMNSDGTESHTTRTEYAYDIYGNQSQLLEYYYPNNTAEAELYLKTVLNHDEAGNVTRQRQYDVSGWFPKKLVDVRYTYDDQGRRISERHSRGLRWDDATITYDDDERTRTTAAYGSTTVEYLDENGWVIRSEATSAGGQVAVEEYDRRPDGLIETTRSYRDGALYSVTDRTYDDQGRPLTWTQTEDGVSTVIFRWEYGEDWEKMTDHNGICTIISFRPDGSRKSLVEYGSDDSLVRRVIYRYTEILVPAKEESP